MLKPMVKPNEFSIVQFQSKRLFPYAVLFVVITLLGLTPCHGADSCIGWPGIDSDSKSLIQVVSKFLGVDPEYVTTFRQIENKWGQEGPPSVTLITDTFVSGLRSVEKQKLSDALTRSQVNLMVMFDSSGPKASHSFLHGLTKYTGRMTAGVLCFSAEHADILKELTGLKVPVRIEANSMFFNADPQRNSGVEPLIWLQDSEGTKHIVMAIKKVGQGRLYLATIPKCQMSNCNETFQNLPQVLPVLIFFKKVFGEFCWHRKTILANLTIDDPWLVEPYGNLSYKELLQQMERVNFHTTIAFVPWNYDRSYREVVELFLKNPGRYSIAFHGNNHNRQEFGNYKDHPYKTQEASISQAVARMEEFTRLTGIPVSQVMIFPHNIAPEQTLETLRQSNFVATINSRILPLGDDGPIGTDVMLGPATLKYCGIPVIQRFNPRVDRSIINILLFLEKPLLFYTHQDYFYKDIGAFNEVARYVNERTRNRVRWVNLKEVCENLYMERLRADGDYEIRMMARSISVKGPTAISSLYRVKETLSGNEDIEQLVINGSLYSTGFERALRKPVALGSGEEMRIEIVYKQPQNQTKVSIRRIGLRNYLIRWLSDLRDRYLSTSKIGRKVIRLIDRIL
jgi:hypothetical protein